METVIFILAVVGLVVFSAICSGLNVGLMSLTIADLKLKSKTGDLNAKRVLPLRQNSHLSLASILLSNVAAISATTLVLDLRFHGAVAGIISTLLIVVFGEVLPQAYFARFALPFCARFAPMLRFMIVMTYPFSKPLQKMLDKLFGKGHAAKLNSRSELGIIIGEHLGRSTSELDDDEVEIIRSTLTLSKKRVRQITTPIKNVYWLNPDSIIDSERIDEIKAHGWSRIPVLNNERTECYGVLLVKELVDIDFGANPKRVIDLPLHATKTVGSMTALDTLFRKFIGARSHLMTVEKNDIITGIVTIEDLIEEILGHEIEDETDQTKRQAFA
ncbi:HlyC/CorC family transporter [soil metagenome]